MHRMMVIQVSDSSDDAALAKVMAGPTESAVAFTSTGNMEQARSATSAIMDADWARNAFRSSPDVLPTTSEASSPTTTSAANSHRRMPKFGSISGPTRTRAYTDTTANRTSAITCRGRRSRAARA